jgi:hypothetical protein
LGHVGSIWEIPSWQPAIRRRFQHLGSPYLASASSQLKLWNCSQKKPSRALEDDAATWKSEFLGSVMYNNKTGKHHQFGGTTLNLLVHNPFV